MLIDASRLGFNAELVGSIPTELGLLTNLETLCVIAPCRTRQPISRSFNASLTRGITFCSLEWRVIDIDYSELGSCGLASTIPTELGLLKQLNSLYVRASSLEIINQSSHSRINTTHRCGRYLASNTGITGTLPTELGSLSAVTYINIWHTSVSGTIPTEIGQLTQLEYLCVSLISLS